MHVLTREAHSHTHTYRHTAMSVMSTHTAEGENISAASFPQPHSEYFALRQADLRRRQQAVSGEITVSYSHYDRKMCNLDFSFAREKCLINCRLSFLSWFNFSNLSPHFTCNSFHGAQGRVWEEEWKGARSWAQRSWAQGLWWSA